ncbi:NAD(P)/FAD-dependent oxidoreductase [Paralimibaculum aggregatum]|uniref:NAD(P)/FAD-dependent oxidoreductase n=1 Tax=Paralimibaculum aggregatum TaxID=3036245 RepID=A0ABQ6LCS1_9RHOB|nr:NAD(P)/FAD-dependent oxidoreductase [Limibaculum sp. NKW23]
MTGRDTEFAIIGGGFAGLSAAYELARAGRRVTLLEAEDRIGGLAAAFETEGERLDRFYHHWFTNDRAVMDLIGALGLDGEVEINPSNTGLYFANTIYRLSSPLDLLRFAPLPFADRIRLGLLALRARRVRDWRALEETTAADWLRAMGGERVFRVVWEPLLTGKFGPHAEAISAVWFWNKLKLRGGSRGARGEERLAYFRGGFVALAEALAEAVRGAGGEIRLAAPVERLVPEAGGWRLSGRWGSLTAARAIATPALPLVAEMVRGWAPADYVARLERIHYLANLCLVLELDRPLSETYWLNVNDPSFPFVGVIEHTNFAGAARYGGRHIVYLSKYLPHTDPLYRLGAAEMLDFALPHLARMFPEFDPASVQRHHLWRARWAQPVVERGYSRLIPPEEGPEGLLLCSMAQIYPEDRGTNYAIREGRRLGARLAAETAPEATPA